MVMHQRFEAKNVVAETQQKVFEKILMRMSIKGALQFFTAETGLGKTTGARLAMRRIWDEVDPSAHFLVLVPTRKDADIFWHEMKKLAPGQSAVWTQSHDPTIGIHADGFTPSCQFTKAQAAKYPCLILTHNAGKAAEGWVGKRDVVLIDEYPQPVSNGVVKPCQFIAARDEEDTAPFLEASIWSESQEERGLQTVGVPSWVYGVVHSTPKSDAGKEIKKLAEHMLAGTAFQRNISHPVWYWYNYNLPFEEKAIVFSATAHLEGWHFDPAQGGFIGQEGVKVDYRNMVAKYYPWPAGVPTMHREIIRDPDHRESFVNYVADKIGFWDSRTLVVCPKDLEKDIARKLSSAKVTHWGCDVGSNEYRDCENVWLVSLFHQPNDVLYSKYLGHSKKAATEESLSAGENFRSTTNRQLKQLHHKTHVKQMAARGTCRNVDQTGIADHMVLNCIFPNRDEFTTWLPELFRGMELQFEVGSVPKTKSKNRSVVAKISDYLRETSSDWVTASDLQCAEIKIKGSKPKVLIQAESERWASMGWVFESGKSGRYSQPSGFRRLM